MQFDFLAAVGPSVAAMEHYDRKLPAYMSTSMTKEQDHHLESRWLRNHVMEPNLSLTTKEQPVAISSVAATGLQAASQVIPLQVNPFPSLIRRVSLASIVSSHSNYDCIVEQN